MQCARAATKARRTPSKESVARKATFVHCSVGRRVSRPRMWYSGRHAYLRPRRRQQRHGGHDAERALGSDVQLLQVVAGVVLAQRAEHVQHGAVGKDDLEPENGAVQRAEAQQARAAGVGRHVAANVAAALGTQIERHGVAEAVNVLIKHLQNASALTDENAGDRVERQDTVHERH